MELGLTNEDGTPTITQDMIDEMEAHVTDIDYEMAAQAEKKLRHDVMAHVHTFGHQCPKAAGIIHLGATSCYVGDNTDVIQMKEGLILVRNKLVQVLDALGKFAKRYKALPTLGYTHFQAAQMVTVGKRATLWMNELLMDLEEVEFRIDNLKLLGSKGTTGTQASFMELFDGDTDKIKALEQKIATEMGFSAVVPVSGQTYSRKMDYAVLSTLSGIAQSASKFATDVRLDVYKRQDEAYAAGRAAVETALAGGTDQMIGFARAAGTTYCCTPVAINLSEVANAEKKVPLDWINEAGNGVNQQFIDYALPLIQGEPKPELVASLPRYAKLKKVFVK